MTNALTLARDALKLANGLSDNAGNALISEALAAIDAELAASADAGRLAQRPHPAKDANGEDFMVCGHDMQRCSTYVECAATKCQRLAALARPAPVSAQGDEVDAARYRALRGTLHPVAHGFADAPRLLDPFSDDASYTAEGLDIACDFMVASIERRAKIGSAE